MIWTRVVVVVACWALLVPFLAASAQDVAKPGEPDAQTVAHGLMAMPAETMVWQTELQRAVVSPRAEAVPQPGGFVLADTGALAITDADGRPLQRLAPGEAAWIEPGAKRAIISLEDRSAGFLRVSLIPASFVPDQPGAASHGEPFPALPGVVDLDLLRDILERGEELVVSSGDTPALLQVTSGKVFYTDESGGINEVAAGSPSQFQGQITISGASRAPAAFVIARMGPQIPARISLLDPDATPVATPWATPAATPVWFRNNASLSIDAWLCPPGYDKSAPITSCTGPATHVRFTAEGAGQLVNMFTDDAGNATFPAVDPGTVRLHANLPAGATTAVASCRNLPGDGLGRVRDDALAVSLAPGDTVSCLWFVAMGDTWPAATLSIAVLTCPPGMTAAALHPDQCLPMETGVALQLSIEGAAIEPAQASNEQWAWGPLREQAYDLTLENPTDGFSGAVLDDGAAGRPGEPLRIDLEDAAASVRTLYLLQPPDASGAERDSDSDGLTDAHELELGADPFLADTDGDGLADGDEASFFDTDPLRADTDDDGLDDQDEVAVFFTNPFLVDTDGDGTGDADEITAQTNPLDMLSLPPTPTPAPTATPSASPAPTQIPQSTPSSVPGTPALTLPASPEATPERVPAALPTLSPEATPITHKTQPQSTPRASSDAAASALDADGLATLDEIAIYGTDPLNPDTDGDGTMDGDEVASGRDPLDAAN